jgi:hypothetical protein
VTKTRFLAEGYSLYFTFDLDAEGRVSAIDTLGLSPQTFKKKQEPSSGDSRPDGESLEDNASH